MNYDCCEISNFMLAINSKFYLKMTLDVTNSLFAHFETRARQKHAIPKSFWHSYAFSWDCYQYLTVVYALYGSFLVVEGNESIR